MLSNVQWNDPDVRLPKRDKDNQECSIDVIISDINDNVFCGYVVYNKFEWWCVSPDGSSIKAPYQIYRWMYIPVIKELNTLPIIDGE